LKANTPSTLHKKGNKQMNSTVSFRKIILAAVVSVASVGLSLAGSNTSFNGDDHDTGNYTGLSRKCRTFPALRDVLLRTLD
jgi:hypothetical protein